METPRPDPDAAITAAADYLESSGFRVLDRSWQSPEGQLDIAAAERRVFVVCEVKVRFGTRHGTPLEAIGRAKLRRLRGLAVAWLDAHGMRFDRSGVDIVALSCEAPAATPSSTRGGWGSTASRTP